MNSVLSRVELAIQEERVRQAGAVLCGASSRFDDRALARVAINAMRDATPDMLAPLAEMLADSGHNEGAGGAEPAGGSRIERHARLIVEAWGAVIDAALELRRPSRRDTAGKAEAADPPLRARY